MTATRSLAASARFDERYFARTYRDYERQNPRRKLEFYRRVVERVACPDAPRRIHDVGCALGRFLAVLGDDWERCGSDVSAYALSAAARVCTDAVLAQADAGAANPFQRPFGVVTAFDVIEHVDDLQAVGRSVAEQLAPAGRFIFVVPVYDGLCGPIVHLLDRDPTHVHKQSRRAWLAWAEEWFDVLEWQGVFRWLVPGGPYLHLPTRRLRRHAPAILVVCRKRGRA